MEIDINTSTYLNSHNNKIYPKRLDPSNHTNTVLSFDSSIYHVPPTNNKNKITTYNQHQVSEIKHSLLSYIQSEPINPTTNIKTTYRKEKSSVHSLENKLTKIRYQFPPVLTTNNMQENKKVQKNVCTNLVQITDILEQTPITDKTHNLYTSPLTKNNLQLPQGTNKKLSRNILVNAIPVSKDPKRNRPHPKQHLYIIFISKINKTTIPSSETIY